MKNIELLGLQDTLQLEPIIRLLEQASYLTNEQIDEILALGEAGLSEMHLALKTYIQKIDIFRSENTSLTFVAHIADIFTELRYEAALEDMIALLRIDFEMADLAMSDGITEYLPDYFALFPHRLDTYKNYVFDATLDVNTKNIILSGLMRAIRLPEVKAQPEPILTLIEDYLRFLQVPENRTAHNTKANISYCYDIVELISFMLIDYDDAGGDKRSELIKYFFDNDLINKMIIGDYEEYLSFDIPHFDISIASIYQKNILWREIEEEEVRLRAENEKEKAKKSLMEARLSLKRSFDNYSRNDKVSVRYEDGRIVKDVKFKKIEDDLYNGLCDIID